MSGQLLRQFAYQARGLSVVLADSVLVQGYYRPVSVIDPVIKQDVAKKTEDAFNMPNIVPENIKAQAAKVWITYGFPPANLKRFLENDNGMRNLDL